MGLMTEGCFNSIKVRLRLDAAMALLVADLFQFHKGSIKTHIDI